MAHEPRVEWFLAKANLNPPLRLSRLTIPADQDFLPLDLPNSAIAHNLLVQARKCSHNYKPPESQVWHLVRTRSQKATACNTSNWTFIKHEIARAFDELIDQSALPPTGVAQALLMQTSLSSIDELWGHLHDQSLEKKMRSKRLSSDLTQLNAAAMTWLDKVVSLDNLNYIHLICQAKVNQAVLDKALGIALSKPSLRAMKLLLCFGADASSYLETIDLHIQAGNLELIELLLSAPDSLGIGAWKECLDREIFRAESGGTFSISFVLLLLSNRPVVASTSLLLSTLRLKNLQATAIVMAYSTSSQVFYDIRHQAFDMVSHYRDDDARSAFFTLLSQCGLIEDSLRAREEVFRDVKDRHVRLVKLFVGDGVAVDEPSCNALQWAVSQLDFEMMEILTRGNITRPPTYLLTCLPEGVSEKDVIHVTAILRSRDVCRQSLVGENKGHITSIRLVK
ncbi:hypothetical protein FLAG1_06088 [Fusarium langsethiae]|uniref:Uncharacterized protein n=1 Tax=Fusarium langsethiae TaxID=179993 RepID=A0A0M9EW10_FUSLA|nr:hypothetical protein FLAG1_06088 [Fusarium langsethiae]